MEQYYIVTWKGRGNFSGDQRVLVVNENEPAAITQVMGSIIHQGDMVVAIKAERIESLTEREQEVAVLLAAEAQIEIDALAEGDADASDERAAAAQAEIDSLVAAGVLPGGAE